MQTDRSFEGIQNLYGEASFAKIQNSHILVIGIGGVGSWCAETLVRSGVGEISLVDMDEICISNINRQIHALQSTIGQTKIEVMQKRLLDINPQVKIHTLFDFFDEKTTHILTLAKYDYIIDAIDSVKPKALLHVKARELEIPIICIGASGARIDATKITIGDLNKSINDRLLKQLKKKLRREHGFSKFEKRPFKIPTVFSTELVLDTEAEGCDLKSGKIKNCQSGLGSASFITASFALFATNYVINQIADKNVD